MLIPHTFEEDGHAYKVEGKTVLSTSDVIYLNGLSDVSMVPVANLEFAGHRGTALHLAIRAYETGLDVEKVIRDYEKQTLFDVMDTVLDRMKGYYRFRDKHEVALMGGDDALAPDEMEVPRVYEHRSTGVLIGATIDFPCYVDGVFTILDVKSAHRNYGKKAMQDHFKWRMQLQSYKEALSVDDEFWKKYKRKPIKKAILHLHPDMKAGRNGYEFHKLPNDDSKTWRSAVIMAQQKLANGFKLDDRKRPRGWVMERGEME